MLLLCHSGSAGKAVGKIGKVSPLVGLAFNQCWSEKKDGNTKMIGEEFHEDEVLRRQSDESLVPGLASSDLGVRVGPLKS